MLNLVSRWFAPNAEHLDYRKTDYLVLFALLAIGAVVRFWGLGNVGLHGDEETMAMPALSILENGQPYLPSGMYYSRALLNILAMSGSVWLFGESEWALRLPSAIVGSFTGLAAFYMGRRFLPRELNLFFVATIVLLPGLIVMSQTARMYVFFVTCSLWFAACIFRWERDQRISSLVLALFVWLLCLHFQRLAVFAAPLFLFPGLSRESWKQLVQGAVAFLVGFLIFRGYARWIGAKYPDKADRPAVPNGVEEALPFDLVAAASHWLPVVAGLVILALFGALLVNAVKRSGWEGVLPPVLLGIGMLAVVALHYHVAAILLVIGALFWRRGRDASQFWLVIVALIVVVLSIVHFWILHDTGLYPGRRLIGAVIGIPSIWPVLRFLDYSPAAGAVYVVILATALWRFSAGSRVPIHFLFVLMSVWSPLLLLGYFDSYIPPRYASGQLGFFLMSVFAGLWYVANGSNGEAGSGPPSRPFLAVVAGLSVAMINPVALATAINPGYDTNPDHKGAAEFIRGLTLPKDAVLIAEDVLQQSYYLGEVQYSLRPIDDAAHYSIIESGRLLDQYTGAVVIGSGDELRSVLDTHSQTEVFIVGSGENFVDGRRMLRGHGIEEVLESDRVEVVFEGRDGKTKVWKARGR